ncbi:hypothetical protein [Streptomyces sp. NPDC056682]|uniref:hypothetical protein n=1 Tax=Streptomyces sp. NPDC056682 TaxID=3345909 RepID=UPI0036C5E8DC
MSADITQVTVHLHDEVTVYADITNEYDCLVIGGVVIHATHASPEVLDAIAQAAMQLAAVRRQKSLKAVA